MSLALSSCTSDTEAAPMAFPGADWQEASPASQGVDAAKLQAAVEYLDGALRDHGTARTLGVVRNGYLIHKGPGIDETNNIASATKSFTSTCLGLLIDDGKVKLETLAKDLVPSLAAQYPTVTLRHFATMTSGYDAVLQGEGYEPDDQGRMDGGLTPFTPAAPIFAPGTKFRYWDKAFMQFGNVLTQAAGEPLDALLKRRIADPIGLKSWSWWPYGGLPRPTLHWTGGINTTSRELARLGHLFLNRGNWNGKQLVSAAWVDAATTVQVPNTVPNDNLPRSRGSGSYGYNWWVNGVRADGKRRWQGATPRTYWANGRNANVCIVIPEWSMVIARTNAVGPNNTRNSPENIDEVWGTFLGKVGEAVGAAQASGRAGAGLGVVSAVAAAEAPRPLQRRTEVSIRGDAFAINGRPTYAGRTWQGKKIEGLLLNSRMVQATFDDLNPETRAKWAYPDTGRWDPERNTREFIAAMPEWRRHGLLAFTINLQGGSPQGYSQQQPWHNSALTESGDFRPEYMARLARVLDRADELGMVAILGIFYFGQDQRLKDEAAVCRAVDNAVDWVLERGYRNVLIEVNNECNGPYDHAILKPARVHELIERVKSRTRDGRRLLVGTSYTGGVVPRENVVRCSDFLLLHGNSVKDPARIAAMVREARAVPGYRPMPILYNEDDNFDFEKPSNHMLAAIGEYCSWGYFDPGASDYVDGYQCPPVNWGLNTDRKRAFFEKVKEITGE